MLALPHLGPVTVAWERRAAAGVLLGVGNARLRRAWLTAASAAGMGAPAIVHPAAWVSPSARLGDGKELRTVLNCLTDLKSGELTHQDVGQMDMYVRMYDELRRGPEDNPTVGIILCAQKDEGSALFRATGLRIKDCP